MIDGGDAEIIGLHYFEKPGVTSRFIECRYAAIQQFSEPDCVLKVLFLCQAEHFLIDAVCSGGEFAEQILSDLIAEGFSGQELLDEFKTRQAKVRPAVEAMLEAAKAAASGTGEYSTYDDIFGSEE